MALNDLPYYFAISFGVFREGLSSIRQDIYLTLLLIGLLSCLFVSLLVIPKEKSLVARGTDHRRDENNFGHDKKSLPIKLMITRLHVLYCTLRKRCKKGFSWELFKITKKLQSPALCN